MTLCKRAWLILATCAVVWAPAHAASAADPRPGPRPSDDAAVSVYLESIPTSEGAVVVATPGRVLPRAQPQPTFVLPRSARSALDQARSDEAKTLERIATAPEYGAPRRSGTAYAAEALEAETASPALTTRTVLVAIAIAAATLIAIAAAWRRRSAPGLDH